MTLISGDEASVVKTINEKVAEARIEGLKTGVLLTTETFDKIDADVKKCAGSR